MMVERRLRVVIPEDHRIVVDVPADVPAGPAELILMVEQPERSDAGEVAAAGRQRSKLPVARAATGRTLPGLSNAAIQRILDEEEAAGGRPD